jgi:nucleotide-binding universal stress UspA family protein
MQTLRHVVSGTDFSEAAERALELALALAAAAQVPVTVVHVCELDIDDHEDQRLVRCGDALSEIVAKHRRGDVELTGVLRTGKPWEKLENVAVDVGASLIVIGRSGSGRGRSAELGSVAGHLVRWASRPVLTVACNFDRFETEAHESNRS